MVNEWHPVSSKNEDKKSVRRVVRKGYGGKEQRMIRKSYETDATRLEQRKKQIAYGENTSGYCNFLRALEADPTLCKGSLPLKPVITQKCSKRSWDGQIRKWRRALHMYDFVDFGDSAEQTEAVREALIEQNKNPLFTKTPKRVLPDGHEVLLTPHPDPNPDVTLPEGIDPSTIKRVQYSFDDLISLSNSHLISSSIELPESLYWLDKRVDLEDDVEDADSAEDEDYASPWMSPFTPGYSPATHSSSPLHDTSLCMSSSSLGTPIRLFADNSPHTSPTLFIGHDECGPISAASSLGTDGYIEETRVNSCWWLPGNNDQFQTQVLQTPPRRQGSPQRGPSPDYYTPTANAFSNSRGSSPTYSLFTIDDCPSFFSKDHFKKPQERSDPYFTETLCESGAWYPIS